jgi:hypothetical protein
MQGSERMCGEKCACVAWHNKQPVYGRECEICVKNVRGT